MARSSKKSRIFSFLKSFGHTPEDDRLSQPESMVFSPARSDNQVDRMKARLKEKGDVSTNLEEVFGALMSIATSTERQSGINRMAVALSPEIPKAKIIYAGSILSPQDMQTNTIPIKLDLQEDKCPLTEKTLDELTEKLNTYFNETLGFGYKVSRWIKDALFGDGSYNMLIVPDIVIDDLENIEVRTESFGKDAVVTMASMDQLDVNLDVSLMLESLGLTEELIEAAKSDYTVMMEGIRNRANEDKSTKQTGKVKNDTDRIRVSTMGEGLVIDLKSYITNFAKNIRGKPLDSSKRSEKKPTHHPVILHIPAHAWVPVCVPGDHSEPVGGYILIDRLGKPVEYTDSDVSPGGITNSAVLRRAYEVMVSTEDGKIKRSSKNLTERMGAMQHIFQTAIEKILTSYVESKGIYADSFDNLQKLSSCILFNTLQKKKVSLLYVPAEYMVSICFDRREDGTGKSMIEDVELPIILRNVLFIANVMANVNNASNSVTINVEVDKKVKDIPKLLEQVYNIYSRKRVLQTSSMDPTTISRNIAQQSIRVVPKGIEGLDRFDVTPETDNARGGMVDTGFIEMFDRMVATGFYIPYSMYNMLDDAEYSKSLGSMNIVFSDHLKQCQWQLQPQLEQYVKLILRFDSGLLESIAQIIKDNHNGIEEIQEEKAASDAGAVQEDDNKSKVTLDELVKLVISKILIRLPAPEISTSKAQLEDIDRLVSTVRGLYEALLDPAALAGDDPNAERVLLAARHKIMVKTLREFIRRTTNLAIDIPGLKEALDQSSDEITDDVLAIENLLAKLIQHRGMLKAKEVKVEEASSSGGGSW